MKKWSFERTVAVANVTVLVVGAVLATIDWYPKWIADRAAARAGELTPTNPNGTLRVVDTKTFPDGTHLYDISYQVNTKNISSRPITITYCISELYVGNFSGDPSKLHSVFLVNYPPTPWDDSGVGGVHWERVGFDASQISHNAPKAVSDFFARHHYGNSSPGGGMTGVVAPGDTTGSRPEFILRARPDEYIGVVFSYGIGSAVSSPSPDINLLEEIQRLDGAISSKPVTAVPPPAP